MIVIRSRDFEKVAERISPSLVKILDEAKDLAISRAKIQSRVAVKEKATQAIHNEPHIGYEPDPRFYNKPKKIRNS